MMHAQLGRRSFLIRNWRCLLGMAIASTAAGGSAEGLASHLGTFVAGRPQETMQTVMQIAQASDGSGASRRKVGDGGRAVWLFTPEGSGAGKAPVVVFLHGWLATDPYYYGGWIDHLVKRGSIVVYPIIEDTRRDRGERIVANAMAGVRLAITTLVQEGPLEPDLGRVYLVGHSMGGGLAAQLAALMPAEGLPTPRVVMPIQPGWAKKGAYPQDVLEGIPGSVFILVIEGDQDQYAENRLGKTIIRRSVQVPESRKLFLRMFSGRDGDRPLISDHFAPVSPLESYRLERKSAGRRALGDLFKSMVGVREGEIDALDRKGFWYLLDVLMEGGAARGCDSGCITQRLAETKPLRWSIEDE